MFWFDCVALLLLCVWIASFGVVCWCSVWICVEDCGVLFLLLVCLLGFVVVFVGLVVLIGFKADCGVWFGGGVVGGLAICWGLLVLFCRLCWVVFGVVV